MFLVPFSTLLGTYHFICRWGSSSLAADFYFTQSVKEGGGVGSVKFCPNIRGGGSPFFNNILLGIAS